MGNTVQIASIEETNHNEESQEQEGGSNFTCEICIEPMSLDMKFKNKCAHHFCMDCMTKYIQVKVEQDVAADIECPGLNCKEFLDPLSSRPLIGHQLFSKWCDNLCDSAILKFDRCYCPYPDCSSLVLNECTGGTLNRSECPNCKRLFCFRCKIPWHAGYKCEESGQVRDNNDILFGQLAEKEKWIRCPRCCHFVERTGGCYHIICRCHMDFCYFCGKMYYPGHFCDDPANDDGCAEILILIACLVWLVLFFRYGFKLSASN